EGDDDVFYCYVFVSRGLQTIGNKMHKAFPLPVIEFPLAEEVPTAIPASAASAETTDTSNGTKKGRTITVTVDDMQKRKNDVKIDEDDMEEMDIKWNMALLSMRADKFWKKTGKNISIQGTDVVGFDKSKVKCLNCHKMGHFAPKELMAIDGVGWDWRYMANYEENHALVAKKEAPTEFVLMANTSAESKVFDNSLCSKDCKKNTDSLNRLAQVESILVEHRERGIKYSSKDLDSLLESQRLDKNKEGLGYSDVPPPPAQIYSSPKKDMSWTGLPEFKDDTVTIYSRHAPTVESSPDDAQNRNPSVTKTKASPSTISPKSFIKFVKANDSPTKSKIEKAEKAKKSPVKYAE
nr:ribonuclease H-like domain-containing protein [Tanacetum cinerariifolium]